MLGSSFILTLSSVPVDVPYTIFPVSVPVSRPLKRVTAVVSPCPSERESIARVAVLLVILLSRPRTPCGNGVPVVKSNANSELDPSGEQVLLLGV